VIHVFYNRINEEIIYFSFYFSFTRSIVKSFSLRLNGGETSIRKQKDNGEMFKSTFSFIF